VTIIIFFGSPYEKSREIYTFLQEQTESIGFYYSGFLFTGFVFSLKYCLNFGVIFLNFLNIFLENNHLNLFLQKKLKEGMVNTIPYQGMVKIREESTGN